MVADAQSAVVVSTSIVSFLSGLAAGIYLARGYLFISPALAAERRAALTDPVESDESDIDEAESLLDHAPNWSNGVDADQRQGLRLLRGSSSSRKRSTSGGGGGGGGKTSKDSREKKKEGEERGDGNADEGEEDWEHADKDTDSTTTPVDIAEGENPLEECKLVLVVRTDLGMAKGKIAAQCGHATLACYRALLRAANKKGSSLSSSHTTQQADAAARVLRRWERFGQAKIAVQTKSQEEMLELMGVARSLGVTAEVIADAGRTQIDPGSLTVLGVGPAPKSLVDQVTGKLKLL